MPEYRPLTGLYKKYWTNQPLANAQIVIRLLTNSFTLEAGYPTSKAPGSANDPGITVDLDENGMLPSGLLLFCTATNIGGGTKYRVTEPDGFEWDFILDYGDGTPISMQTLRAGGLPAGDPETVNSLIENKILSSAIRFDIAQDLTTEQQDIAKGNLDITPETVSSLGTLINGASEKTTPAPEDYFGYVDSAASNVLRKISWASWKIAIKYYYDPVVSTLTNKNINGADNTISNIAQSSVNGLAADLAKKSDKLPTIDIVTGTSYTLVAADLGKVKRFTNNSAITLTVPASLGENFNCAVIQRGTGQIAFTASGTTLSNPNGHTKSVKDGVVTIFADSADNFIFQGATE